MCFLNNDKMQELYKKLYDIYAGDRIARMLANQAITFDELNKKKRADIHDEIITTTRSGP